MKVLVLGSGAREHAIGWKFSKSKRISGLYIAPGNAGTDEIGENLPGLNPLDHQAVVDICVEKKIDLVFVGPEDPLAAGIVDRLTQEKIPVFGPHKAAAELESSKAFAKRFMDRHGIPTAEAWEFESASDFEGFMKKHTQRVVVKKSGLAGGKGVLDSESVEELVRFGRKALQDDRIVVEEHLKGIELSLFALTDGTSHVVLPVCADFKKAGENDEGKNTGGMGAVCPVPVVDAKLIDSITATIIDPTFTALAAEGLTYRGVLFFGLMVTDAGPRLLEFNVRFGDPETQVLIPLIDSDFGSLCESVVQGKLQDFPLHVSSKTALAVVVASKGYPDNHKTGIPVKPLPTFPESEVLIFHSATKVNGAGQILTGGGRCFTVVGIGSNLLASNERAYEAASRIEFEGAWCRRDIGKKFFID